MILLDACLDVVHSVEASLRRHGVGQSGVDCKLGGNGENEAEIDHIRMRHIDEREMSQGMIRPSSSGHHKQLDVPTAGERAGVYFT